MKIFCYPLIIFISLVMTAEFKAQEYANSYYLVDSLDLSELTEADFQLIDNCLKQYHSAHNDTVRVNAINMIVEGSWDDNVWPRYNLWVYRFVKEKLPLQKNPSTIRFFKMALARSLNNIGFYHKQQGDIAQGLMYYQKSLEIRKEINDKEGIAESYTNIGYIYMDQGDMPDALDYYFKSLRLNEELDLKNAIAICYNNIGYIYEIQDDQLQALYYYQKSLELAKNLGDKRSMAGGYNNIGSILSTKGEFAFALENYQKSLELEEELDNKLGMAITYNNIGSNYESLGDTDAAIQHYQKSALLCQETGYKQGLALSFYNIGKLKSELGKWMEAKEYGEKSLQISQAIGFPRLIESSASLMSEVAKHQGNYARALEMYELYIEMRDSVTEEEIQRVTIQQEYKYIYDKKAATDSIKALEEEKLHTANLMAQKVETEKQKARVKQQEQQKYYLFVGLSLAILFGGFIFNRFRVTSRQKNIIEDQKTIVEHQKREVEGQKQIVEEAHQKLEQLYVRLEESHKEITDSINYAERIQRSFLATKEILDEHLRDYFVFFKPKDIVSGDFYWAAELNNGNFAWSCADSTGHGVPGAIMSLLNISSLEKSIETETSPEKILCRTREIIISRLKKDGSEEGGKDGMDCNLMVMNKDRTELTFASAQNPIVVVRGKELIEYKGDKLPVGKHDRDAESFTLQTLKLQKGDVIYALTDGFPDQFGGEKGKKYMIKNLKNKLLEIASFPMSEQQQILTQEFDAWKRGYEQVDDVCVIGVRV